MTIMNVMESKEQQWVSTTKRVVCAEPGCRETSYGYDIEKCWDDNNEPIYAVYYECEEGHLFIAEFNREVNDE